MAKITLVVFVLLMLSGCSTVCGDYCKAHKEQPPKPEVVLLPTDCPKPVIPAREALPSSRLPIGTAKQSAVAGIADINYLMFRVEQLEGLLNIYSQPPVPLETIKP